MKKLNVIMAVLFLITAGAYAGTELYRREHTDDTLPVITCPETTLVIQVGENDPEKLLEGVRASGAELIVLAGFLSILSENFVHRWPDRIVNIHPSLIPAFCGKGYYGLKVHEEALRRGVKVTGATVHLVNEIPDGGRILLQKAVEVLPGDTPEVLQRRVMEQAEWVLLPRAVEQLSAQIASEKEDHL